MSTSGQQKTEPATPKHEHNLFDKIPSTFGLADTTHPVASEQTPHPLPPTQHSAGEQLIEKLTGVFHEIPASGSAPHANEAHPNHPDWVGSIAAATGLHQYEQRGPPALDSSLPSSSQKHEGLTEKLVDVFGLSQHVTTDTSVPPTVPSPSQPELRHGLLDNLSHVFEGESHRKKKQEEEEAERRRLELEAEKNRHHGFRDKLSGLFEGEEGRKRREEEAEQRRVENEAGKARHHHLPLDMFEKLGLGNPSPTAATPPKTKGESLLDRLGSTLHPTSEEIPLGDQSFAERVESMIHHKEDNSHVHSGGISDKIQSAMGGGSKAEDNEDDLDKAIDFVQHHILRQGTQSHESVVEQMKDEQIARTIRAQYKILTGHEFPLKKGAKHWH